ncbi:MAG: RyR domain-containing protein [Pseudomonadota bacterium]
MTNVLTIAMICHEANRAYARSLGDFSHKPWERAPDWQKMSAISGVQFHLAGDKTPAESHESWISMKLATGWTYGTVKNEKAKTHPCLMAYDLLPEDQKAKDRLFGAIVGAFK